MERHAVVIALPLLATVHHLVHDAHALRIEAIAALLRDQPDEFGFDLASNLMRDRAMPLLVHGKPGDIAIPPVLEPPRRDIAVRDGSTISDGAMSGISA